MTVSASVADLCVDPGQRALPWLTDLYGPFATPIRTHAIVAVIQRLHSMLRSTAIRGRLAVVGGWRRRRLEQLSAQQRAPITVLFYHRVADEYPNPWTIGVAEFEAQLDYCRTEFEVIGLDEVQRRLSTRRSPRPAVAITFDDGYADNFRYALPALIRHRIPCTYFVSTGHIRSGKPFAHDVEYGQPLPVNTIEEVQAIANCGIDIGLHTADHFDFSRSCTREDLRRQITDAKRELESWLDDQPVRYFAVPYGMPRQMRTAVFAAARRCGLQGVCSAYGAYNQVGEDPFHIKRVHGDPDQIRLRNWLSYDPRKARRAPSIPLDEVGSEGADSEFASGLALSPPDRTRPSTSKPPLPACDSPPGGSVSPSTPTA